MSNFRTIVGIREAENKICYGKEILLFGSCFTENIGNRLSAFKFNTTVNPFGIIYNPASVKNGLDLLLDNKAFTEDDLFFYNERWNSFHHHGNFSNSDKTKCLSQINKTTKHASDLLKRADFLFITFGTAWIYKLKSTGTVVSNCHKVPSSEFDRSMLSVDQIYEEYSKLLLSLHSLNPNLHVVFTVSPVRHLKDGAHGNQLSKSTLLLAIDKICENHKKTDYFPAYEIVMDDLRDYRFYNGDMVHPNETAIDYIWHKFSDIFIDTPSRNTMKEVEKIIRAVSHRPFNQGSEGHKKFTSSCLGKIAELKQSCPSLNFDEEEKYFRLAQD